MKYYRDAEGNYLGGWDENPPEGAIEVPFPPDDARFIWTGVDWAEPPAVVQARLTDALNRHLDAVAGQRRYDNRFTCSLRAGFTGPFQSEGLAFAAWMDACNLAAYTIMAECKAGLRPIPTEAELIAAMPEIQWPPSPVPDGALLRAQEDLA